MVDEAKNIENSKGYTNDPNTGINTSQGDKVYLQGMLELLIKKTNDFGMVGMVQFTNI